MTENTTQGVDINKFDGKGALWTIAGTTIAAVAGQLLGHGGGLFGGGYGGNNAIAQAANTTVAYEMAKKDSEIAQLKADAATDKKLVEVYTELRKQDKAQDEKIALLNTRVTTLETSAPLREQIVLGQVQSVANTSAAAVVNLQTQIGGIQTVLGNITKCIVPKSAVCPEPMPLYNSWTAPTTPTTQG